MQIQSVWENPPCNLLLPKVQVMRLVSSKARWTCICVSVMSTMLACNKGHYVDWEELSLHSLCQGTE